MSARGLTLCLALVACHGGQATEAPPAAPIARAPVARAPVARTAPSEPATADAGAAPSRFSIQVATGDRACVQDGDCVTIHADCSNRVCVGVSRAAEARYAGKLDCEGYTGGVSNYDCDPRLCPGCAEGPRCLNHQCESVKRPSGDGLDQREATPHPRR